MTRLTAGHIVRLPEGGQGSLALALVTEATAKAVTVTTGSLGLMFAPEWLTFVGLIKVGERSRGKTPKNFRRTTVHVEDDSWGFDITVREPGQPEITAVGDIRKLAFARWLEVKS